jgi:hypothetical protein
MKCFIVAFLELSCSNELSAAGRKRLLVSCAIVGAKSLLTLPKREQNLKFGDAEISAAPDYEAD